MSNEVIYLQEVGHFLAAFPKKVKLSIPYFIPNITLGSFGAITQVNIFAILALKISHTWILVQNLILLRVFPLYLWLAM